MTTPTRFDEAWEQARALARSAAENGHDVVLVRDLSGRSTLLVDDRNAEVPPDPDRLAQLGQAFRDRLGPFAGDNPVQSATSMFSADMFFDASELIVLDQRDDDGHGQVGLLERTVVGADWSHPGVEQDPVRSRCWCRIALYGFKGGVGRSTATAVLARHLAEQGRCVLVVDLDLESPGVSSLLADPGAASRHGIVDHLVELAVGNADGLELLAKSSLTPKDGNGEIWLASHPAPRSKTSRTTTSPSSTGSTATCLPPNSASSPGPSRSGWRKEMPLDDLTIARALHVVAVVHWIGGVSMVTLVILPGSSISVPPAERLRIFEAIEARFGRQARISMR